MARRLLSGTWPTEASGSKRSWPRRGSRCSPANPARDALGSGSRWRSAFRASSGFSGSGRPWPRAWWGWSPGSRRRWQPTPTPFSSTGCWDVLKVASRSYGHEPGNTHLGSAIPPTISATESPTSDQASQEAVRIPPTTCPCSLTSSVTTPLYSTTVSQALRQPLRTRRSRANFGEFLFHALR